MASISVSPLGRMSRNSCQLWAHGESFDRFSKGLAWGSCGGVAGLLCWANWRFVSPEAPCVTRGRRMVFNAGRILQLTCSRAGKASPDSLALGTVSPLPVGV